MIAIQYPTIYFDVCPEQKVKLLGCFVFAGVPIVNEKGDEVFRVFIDRCAN